jgi:cytochrome c biogenesis protein CcmG/thiol:disulfide interchange protein DsbE
MKTWHIILIAGLVGLLSLFYKGLWGDPRAIPTVLIGTPAPTFLAPDLHTGEAVQREQYQGKVVMLNFWASWCLECRVEHANLLEINKRYKDNPNFVMLGVNYQDQEPDALKYLEVYGNNFRHVRDLKGAISIDFGVYGVPETFVIDQHGVIRFKLVGPVAGPAYTNLINNIIEPLLKGQPVQQAAS